MYQIPWVPEKLCKTIHIGLFQHEASWKPVLPTWAPFLREQSPALWYWCHQLPQVRSLLPSKLVNTYSNTSIDRHGGIFLEITQETYLPLNGRSYACPPVNSHFRWWCLKRLQERGNGKKGSWERGPLSLLQLEWILCSFTCIWLPYKIFLQDSLQGVLRILEATHMHPLLKVARFSKWKYMISN